MSVIRLEKTYPVPKESVWSFLVNNELLSSWCMPTKGFALAKGQTFSFEMKPSIFWDGKFHNKVMDYEEFSFLTYECISNRPSMTTVVKWMLTEENGKTKLSLEHSGFKGKDLLTKIMLTGGWRTMINTHLYEKLTDNR